MSAFAGVTAIATNMGETIDHSEQSADQEPGDGPGRRGDDRSPARRGVDFSVPTTRRPRVIAAITDGLGTPKFATSRSGRR